MDFVRLICCAFIGLFRCKASLEAEIFALRQQLNVLRRKSPERLIFSDMDRLVFAGLYHFAPSILNALAIVKPETVSARLEEVKRSQRKPTVIVARHIG